MRVRFWGVSSPCLSSALFRIATKSAMLQSTCIFASAPAPANQPRYPERLQKLVLKRIGHKYRVVPFRAGGEECYRRADQLLDVSDIFDGLGRKVVPAARAGGGAFPPFQRLVDRFDTRLRPLARRPAVDHLAVDAVG